MKTSAKFIAAADLHLNINMWTNNKAIAYDSLFSLYNILNLADQLQLPVVFAGDIFDTKMISSELFSHVFEIRKLFPNVDLYYVNGNHDSANPSWLSHLPNNVIKLGKDPVIINGLEVCGLDYQLVSDFEDALRDVYPYADVLITHQTYTCFFNTSSAIDVKLLANRKTVISGDYHKLLDYYLTGDIPTHVISPGNASKCTVAESYPHVLLMYAGDDYMQYKPVALPHRSFSYIANIQEQLKANYTVEDIQQITNKYQLTDRFDSEIDLSTVDIKLCAFYDCVRRAQSVNRDPVLHNVYIATDKEQVKFGAELVDAVGSGYVLYSPVLIPPVSQDEVDRPDGGDMYLKSMLKSYPADPNVKAAAEEFIFGESNDFFEKENQRFGICPTSQS